MGEGIEKAILPYEIGKRPITEEQVQESAQTFAGLNIFT